VDKLLQNTGQANTKVIFKDGMLNLSVPKSGIHTTQSLEVNIQVASALP
jgi:hypothetical protein